MTVEVTLPELGESVTEGTITAWLVDVGERVEADQPLFELSSDKIDTEVPAPVRGVLKEIKVQVDETVDVGTVVAIISESDEETADPQTQSPSTPEPEPAAAPSTSQRTEQAREPKGNGEAVDAPMSPIVRRMVAEHGLDVSQIPGSGLGGRITREDVEATLKASAEASPDTSQPSPEPPPIPRPTIHEDERTRVEELSRIRQRIAAKMMESLQSSAQLTTVQEADATRIMRLRDQIKDEFRAREGVSLSPFVFFCRAAVLAIRSHPKVNALADFDAGKVAYHDYVNLGIAVDTEKGLIVPNVKGADDLSLAGLARAITAAADKARGRADEGRLEISDLRGGTFTMSNTGSRGVLIDTPILNYPEVAILATGKIQKRPVVVEDSTGSAIAIRDMVYLCLTYDHRLIDGADAARFVTAVQEVIETHDWAAEVGY